MQRKYRVLFFLLFTGLSYSSFAQTLGNSPYSRLGPGDINPDGMIRNLGMGGIGVSSGRYGFINNINPAFLNTNKTKNRDSSFTIIEAAMIGDFRRFSDAEQSSYSMGANFYYFNLAFPFSSRSTTNIGLRPYSTVNYSIENSGMVNDIPVRYNYNGAGGLYQAHISNGFDFTRNFSGGIQVSYLFGNIRKEYFASPDFVPDLEENESGIVQVTSYQGFAIRPGIAFSDTLSRKSKILFNAGLTYEFSAGMQGLRTRNVVTRDPEGNVLSDSLIHSAGSGTSLPSVIRGGISLNKALSWTVGAEFIYRNYSVYRDFEVDYMNNSFTIAAGGEYLMKKEDPTDLRRITIRSGFSWTRTPYILNGQQIDDFALSLGGSFPMGKRDPHPRYGRFKPLSSINAALIAGQRGTINEGLLKENYFRLFVGMTINEKWFERRRID